MWLKAKEKGLSILNQRILIRNLATVFLIALTIIILYSFYPSSFELTWKGRMLYVFFIWLVCLTFLLNWKGMSATAHTESKWRIVFFVALMLVPSLYALASFYTGLNQQIIDVGRFLGVPYGNGFGSWFLEYSWLLSVEYVLFAGCLSVSILFIYNKQELKMLAVPVFFLWAIAAFYMLDTFFPYGTAKILEFFVPLTANSAARVLNFMGYPSETTLFGNPLFGVGTVLTTSANESVFSAVVYWSSAGVHSMFIYSLAIVLFVKDTVWSFAWKTVVFAVGAVGTFFVNVLRIATICVIGLNVGNQAAIHFHDYVGEFFFITWLLSYIAVVFLGPKIILKLLVGKSEAAKNIATQASL